MFPEPRTTVATGVGFFIPRADSDEQAEHIYDAIRKFAHDTLGWYAGDARIYRIRFEDQPHKAGRRRVPRREVVAEVGKDCPLTRQLVVAILDSNTYLICTPSRGFLRGEPILVGKDTVREATLFDPDAPIGPHRPSE